MEALPTPKLVGAELLKIRKRWLPYILLLPIVGALALQTFVAYFAGWRGERDVEALRVSALPWSLGSLLDLTQFLVALMWGVVAASAVGTEFGWGTARQALARGQPRSHFLTTKVAGLLVLGAAGFAFTFAVGLLFSAIVTALEDLPFTLEVPNAEDLTVWEIALMLGRTFYVTLPYMLLGFTMAVLGRSTTMGVTSVLVYALVESIVLAVLGGVGGAAAEARAYFLGHNVMALLAQNNVGPTVYFSLAPRGTFAAFELPPPGNAAAVVGLYCIGLYVLAHRAFQRRDMLV